MAGAGAAYKFFGNPFKAPRADLVYHSVNYEALQLTIVERGQLESADNRDVICKVKAGNKGSTVATTIKWVIDDGSPVKQGQLIVELDDSGLQEQLKSQRIARDKASSDFIKAEEDYKILLSQNNSDIEVAKTDLEIAKLNLEKYLDGDYPQALKLVLGNIKNAESDRDMQQDRSAWAERMVKKGYMTASQAQAELSRLESYDITLKKAQEELRVLNNFTKKLMETDFRSKLEEKKRALERVQLQAKAKEVQAEALRKSTKSVYQQEQSHFDEIEEEIRKCRIYAPQDGMVVYFVPENTRYGSGSRQTTIAQGEPVVEGQKLIRIPDLKHMLVNTKVHEAMVSKVKGEDWKLTGFGDSIRTVLTATPDALTNLLAGFAFTEIREQYRDKEQQQIFGGQKARIRVDAFPERILQGHVKSVATVAGQMDWISADVKTYQTMVAIDEPVERLKPQMSAEVTIIIEDQLEKVLAVPLQAIFGSVEMGGQRKCFVMNTDGQAEERDIEVGLSNDKMAEIKTGLQEGDQVVLNPRVLLNEKNKNKKANGDKTAAGTEATGKSDGRRGPGGKRPGGGPPGGGPDGGDFRGNSPRRDANGRPDFPAKN